MSPVPPVMRAEGLSDLTGDVMLTCPALPPIPLDLRMTLNTAVTNNRNYLGPNITDAVLLVELPCMYWPCPPPLTLFGRLLDDNRTLQWQGLPILPPGSVGLMRIANVRAAVHDLGGTPNAPAIVTGVVGLYPSGSPMPLFTASTTLGFGTVGIRSSVTTVSATETFRLKIEEGNPEAWKPLGLPLSSPVWGPTNQEDGFLTPGSGKNGGGATQGTRIIVRFLNAPNVNILVPNQVNSGALELRRAFNADATGAGGCIDFSCLAMPPSWNLAEATTVGKDAFAVYEVTASIPYTMEFVELPVYLCKGREGCKPAGTVGLRDMLVRVSLAPVSTANSADSVSPRPRFAETGIPIDLLRWPK